MDRRVKRTKKRLRDAIVSILKEKNVEDVTVSELANCADINRGTFYTHYRDASDLLNSLENELFNELDESFAKKSGKYVLESVFTVINDNKDIVSVLLDIDYHKAFYERLVNTVENGAKRVWVMEEFVQQSVMDNAYKFLAGGVCNLISEFVAADNERTVIEMAVLAEIFVMSIIKTIK